MSICWGACRWPPLGMHAPTSLATRWPLPTNRPAYQPASPSHLASLPLPPSPAAHHERQVQFPRQPAPVAGVPGPHLSHLCGQPRAGALLPLPPLVYVLLLALRVLLYCAAPSLWPTDRACAALATSTLLLGGHLVGCAVCPALLNSACCITARPALQRISIGQIKQHPWFLRNLPEELRVGWAAC